MNYMSLSGGLGIKDTMETTRHAMFCLGCGTPAFIYGKFDRPLVLWCGQCEMLREACKQQGKDFEKVVCVRVHGSRLWELWNY